MRGEHVLLRCFTLHLETFIDLDGKPARGGVPCWLRTKCQAAAKAGAGHRWQRATAHAKDYPPSAVKVVRNATMYITGSGWA